MNYPSVGLFNLPNEILLIILAKLKNVDILYSLMGVNERLDRLVCNNAFTQSVDLVAISSDNVTNSLPEHMLNRLYLDILPRIHQSIKCFTLEPLSIGYIFHTCNYSNLHKLNFVKLDIEEASYYFNRESPFAHIFKNQITHLVVTIINGTKIVPLTDIACGLYASIFTLFKSLTHLEFGTYNTSQHRPLSVYCLPPNICFSSNIVHLCIKVLIFDDCLCLLNGRLPRMNTFIVTVETFLPVVSGNINKTKGLDNLKCFSLMSYSEITTYDNQIVGLLCQMSQLEKLTLSLNIYNRTTFIDGTHLNKEILSHMPHLHEFNFDLVTHSEIANDIRCTFVQDVDYYIDYLRQGKHRCHVYSLPFSMECMQDITNNFPGGTFMSIRTLCIFDGIHPFEHDFFRRISRSFPLLRSLTVVNSQQQNEKQTRQLYNDEKICLIVEFPYLLKLDLKDAHIDYVEQFLIDTNTHLPCLDELRIQFEKLQIVTENFTRNSTRAICAKLKHRYTSKTTSYSEEFHLDFPLL